MKRKHLLFKEAVCKNRKSLIKLFVNISQGRGLDECYSLTIKQ